MPQILRNKKQRHNLALALTDILQGISVSWQLSLQNLADILFRDLATIQQWLDPQGCIQLPTILDHNTQAIIDFIDIYNLLAAFFVKKSDQILWLHEPQVRFDNISLIDFIKVHPHNLVQAKKIIRQLINP